MPYENYLIRSRHRTKWYARVVVPHDMRRYFRHCRGVLNTLSISCKTTAKRCALNVWLADQEVFGVLMNKQSVNDLNPPEVPWRASRLLLNRLKMVLLATLLRNVVQPKALSRYKL